MLERRLLVEMKSRRGFTSSSGVTLLRKILQRNALIIPVYLMIVLLLLLMAFVAPSVLSMRNVVSILVIASITAVVGLGQESVILTGGIDLSIPASMTTAGIILTTFSHGEISLAWVIPAILLSGTLIGLINGTGVSVFGISPIIMTLAVNAIVMGSVLIPIHGAVRGITPPAVAYFMSNRLLGVIPSVLLFVTLLYGIALFVLFKTAYGRRLYTIGNNIEVARLSGINVPLYVTSVYIISGILGAIAGVMLTGYSTYAYAGMADPYLLISIAVVVIGGASILGGSGTPIGTLGGAIMLTLLSTLLNALLLPVAYRQIILGGVLLLSLFIFSRKTRNV